MIDWNELRSEYVTGDTNFRKLAMKYDLDYHRVWRRGQAEDWNGLRSAYRQRLLQEAMDTDADRRMERLLRVQDASDQLLSKMVRSIGELDKQMVRREVQWEEEGQKFKESYLEARDGGLVDRAGVKQLSAALRDIKEVQMLKSQLDEQEQEAKLALLKRQAETAQTGDAAITVRLEGGCKEFGM